MKAVDQIEDLKIGIIGNGYVGKATRILECDEICTLVYDIDPDKCSPTNTQLEDLVYCNFVFVCVPTPMNKDGSCNTSIVSSVISDLADHDYPLERIVVRSTVPVGFCSEHKVSFMPEFLTEANWEDDFKNADNRIMGIDGDDFSMKQVLIEDFRDLYSAARKHKKTNKKILDDTLIFCRTREAELSKLVRNSFLATKVSFFNEIYQFCSSHDVNYRSVVDMVSLDDRIGSSHTDVPGPDGKAGFGGTCFPKDTNSLLHQMKNSLVLKAVVERNQKVDRPEHDWESDKGRAVTLDE